MKLSKEDIALLDADPKAFLVAAFFTAHPDASRREAARRLGIPESSFRRRHCGAQSGAVNGAQNGAVNGARKSPKKELVTADCGAQSGAANGAVNPPTLTARLKPTFDDFFRSVTDQDFYWSPKEMKALQSLGAQLRHSIHAKGNPDTDADVALAFPAFLQLISDPWILSHLSPSTLSSKYNEILASFRAKPLSRQDQQSRNAADLAQFRKDADALLAGLAPAIP